MTRRSCLGPIQNFLP